MLLATIPRLDPEDPAQPVQLPNPGRETDEIEAESVMDLKQFLKL